MNMIDRRNFLRSSVIGGAALAFSGIARSTIPFAKEEAGPTSVALTTGTSRADMAFRALQPFSKQIQKAIGNKLIVVKPNNVSITVPLSATHADTLEGVLEFLKSIKKIDNVIIAESAGNGPSLEGFSNYGYNKVAAKYPVKMVDLDSEGYEILYVFDEKDFRPHPVRISSVLLNPDSYIISVARMKTHDRVTATLSLKNIVFGAPLKVATPNDEKRKFRNEKPIVHGSGYRGINYNLFTLAPKLHPDLALIDGFEGMEGNGPIRGTAVDHRVCVAGIDWLAADRVAVELMGLDFNNIGYLTFCSEAGLGTSDLSKIQIIGENVKNHIKTYKLNDTWQNQLIWKTPVS